VFAVSIVVGFFQGIALKNHLEFISFLSFDLIFFIKD